MVKKCVVKYDELGKPIEIVELKEFSDPRVLSEFKKKCEENKFAKIKREELKKKEQQENELFLEKQIKLLKIENLHIRELLAHLFGYKDMEEERIQVLLEMKPEESGETEDEEPKD